jgi:hypothetical protein
MTWTYNSSLPTNKDKVRALVGDVDDNDHLIEDELIAVFLVDTNQNIYRAAAMGCATAAQILVGRGGVQIGPLSVDYGEQSQAMIDKATLYNGYADLGYGFDKTQLPAWEPKDSRGNPRGPNFDIGMHDHPVSLIQEFGEFSG